MNLILASHSRGRAQLLRGAGYFFSQEPSNAPEPSREPEEPLEHYVQRIAEIKARAVAARYPRDCVLAADTVLELGGRTIGKPGNFEEAVQTLLHLAGQKHTVASGHALVCLDRNVIMKGAATAHVSLRAWPEERVHRYVNSVQPYAFAGGYALQGEGVVLVEKVEGDPSTVIGMHMGQVEACLEALGVS